MQASLVVKQDGREWDQGRKLFSLISQTNLGKVMLVIFLVMTKGEYCIEFICLNYTVSVQESSDFHSWTGWSLVGLIYQSRPQPDCAVTSRQCSVLLSSFCSAAHWKACWKTKLSYGWPWQAVSFSFAVSECGRGKGHKGTIFCVTGLPCDKCSLCSNGRLY